MKRMATKDLAAGLTNPNKVFKMSTAACVNLNVLKASNISLISKNQFSKLNKLGYLIFN